MFLRLSVSLFFSIPSLLSISSSSSFFVFLFILSVCWCSSSTLLFYILSIFIFIFFFILFILLYHVLVYILSPFIFYLSLSLFFHYGLFLHKIKQFYSKFYAHQVCPNMSARLMDHLYSEAHSHYLSFAECRLPLLFKTVRQQSTKNS